jgi:hypothetical protein
MAQKDLIPFVKGQSGNPKGRPKGIPNSKQRFLRLLELTQKKKNPVTGEIEEFTVAEQMDMAIISKALKGDINAYKEILDRLEGKSKSQIDVTTDGEKIIHEVDYSKLSSEVLLSIVNASRRK